MKLPIEKLRKLVTLLSSDHPGEVVAASQAIGRLLKEAGADWHDLAKALGGQVVRPPLAPAPWDTQAPPVKKPPPLKPESERPHVADVRWCLANGKFTTREKEFLNSLIDWNVPTQKQLDWLKRLEVRTGNELLKGQK